MRKFVRALTLVFLLTSCITAGAEPAPMSADEFNQLLTGNTMRGIWGESKYQQYFDSNGQTIYQEEGKPETIGTWRINTQAQFCSIWPPGSDEYCYNVAKDGETLLWDDGQGNTYHATLEQGKTF